RLRAAELLLPRDHRLRDSAPQGDQHREDGLPGRDLAAGVFRRGGVLEIGLHRALVLDRHGAAVAVDRLADGEAHPALADAVFLAVGLFLAVEPDADAAFEQFAVVVLAGRIGREA